MLSLINTLWNLNKDGITATFKDIPYCSDLVLARTKIFGEFYRNVQYTHLLMVDADMGWNGGAVPGIMRLDKEFIASPGVKKKYPIEYCSDVVDGITYVGMGFVIINRRCAEKLAAAYPETKCRQDKQEEYLLFNNIFHGEDRLPEDYSFCHRWGTIGGEIQLISIGLTHTGSHTFRDVTNA